MSASILEKLSLREKVSYGLGDFGFNLYWTTLSAFGLIFFTDIFGISPAAAGSVMLISRILDALSDPVMGAIADRTKTKFGRFRPYVLGGAVPLAIMGVLTFTTPALAENGKVVYAAICYSLLMFAYTIGNIPYSALSGVMSANSQERTTLNSFRFIGGFLGGTFVTYLTPLLVKTLGQGNDAKAWPMVMAVYGALTLVIMLVLFLNTRERVEPAPEQHSSPMRDVADLMANRPWVILFILALVIMVTITLRMGVSSYYMRYVVESETSTGAFADFLRGLFGTKDLIGPFLTIYGFALAGGAALTPVLTRFFDKRSLLMGLMGIVAVLSAAFYFIPTDQIELMFAVQVLIGLALGPKSPLTFSMLADAADYNEYRTHRRATGMTYAAGTFSQKLGGALAPFGIGLVLSGVGYIANQPQTPEVKHSILLVMSIAPGVAALIAAVCIGFYTLTQERMAEITRELDARRAKSPGT